ncbi:bifunctional phosphopantothenoylcysteine decarboxylase/phosphopantothenate--cysteine ligase CoaBC [Halomonas halocynthiae]|uniref:bifunctional phosphopantothenoylcysteine decarboxylase/phosphopantothenate--cysteine ligase CoaBC n=1 Tax=Halomonas halocynthiae TaxID=176290 RepID=UPI0004849199|nr:bifunctional phosphopantothenoylcysteine decarboxylase/phosphopantothenate--cysteine ligase CoaBC [Halomonas halocynthiae]
MSSASSRRILLGISGGIAAYKSAQLARLLKQNGHQVRVVMTQGAQAFITPLTLQALTGEAVRTSLLDPEAEAGMGHIELARWADTILIAPATADLMARLAHGHADDLLTTLCLASPAQKIMAPAMNQAMWAQPATARNAQQLRQDGWQLLGPDSGEQACGDIGPGRMLEPEAIFSVLHQRVVLAETSAHKQHIVITAGPTREPLDPVRYLSNHSSGKMGYALATAALELGAKVTLISGPVSLPTPTGAHRVEVETAVEMANAAEQFASEADVFIGCAAVADYRAEAPAEHKLKKRAGEDGLTLRLIKNPDIIAAIAQRPRGQNRPYMVGFAAETRDLEDYARDKLTRKNLDMVVANDVSLTGLGFGVDNNAALLLWRDSTGKESRQELPPQPKIELARTILHQALIQQTISKN